MVGVPASAVPQRLGNYRLVKDLARGGMAQVTLACDASGTHVVLKRIRGEQAEDPKLVQMFVDEAKLASTLRHPNIVAVYDSGADAGEYFFAMEYVHGEDLRTVLREIHNRRDRLPIAQVLTVIGCAAAGLHHAHQAVTADGRPLGLVHRDVSPANILVGYNGIVKVTDFGIAKATLHSVETRSGTLKGKVAYMSPEQVTGRPIDRRSDVFALGIVFYEVATARRLFKNDNDFLTMTAIVQGEIPPPSQHRPDLPRPVEKMIMKALEPDPADRYQTAQALLDDIEGFMRSIGQTTNANGVADYMKALFGHRLEPWLVETEITQIAPPLVDFDGSDSGIVAPPAASAANLTMPKMPKRNTPPPGSLIVRAHEEMLSAPTFQPLVETQAVHVPAPQRQRRWLVRGAAAAVSVAVIGLIAVKVTSKTSSPTPSAAPSPTPDPTPTPNPPPPPIAAPAPAPVAAPAPAPVAAPAPAAVPAPVAAAVPVRPPPPSPQVAKPAPPPPPIVAKAPPVPVVHRAPAPPKPPPAKKPPAKDQAWDPNSLFAPK
jgi:serine/threonine-protein kinase